MGELPLYRLKNRAEAGQALAQKLLRYAGQSGVVVIALPRGGVMVAAEIAEVLGLPLDILVVRKLGVPDQPELAMGAIASGGAVVMNDDIVRKLGIAPEEIRAELQLERRERERSERAYRGHRSPIELRGKTVILVDDGVATGATLLVAIDTLRRQGVASVVVAVGVAPPATGQILRRKADEVVCLLTPDPFSAISLWYDEFPQTTDTEVQQLVGAQAPV